MMSNLTNLYKVGIIGAGNIVINHHLPILTHLAATKVAFVADINKTAAKRAARTYETTPHVIDDISALPECDVVALTPPVGVRSEYIQEFASRGTPILAEKPFAIDLAEHEKYLNWTDEIMTNYIRMEYGTTQQLQYLMDQLPFGTLQSISIAVGEAQTAVGLSESQVDPTLRGGQLHELGSHLLSQIMAILRPRTVETQDATVEFYAGIDIDITARFTAESNATSIPVDFEFSRVRNLGQQATYCFENGVVRYDPTTPDSGLSLSFGEKKEKVFDIKLPKKAPENDRQAMLCRWLRFLNELESNTIDAPFQTGRTVTKTITDIYNAAGQWPGEEQ